MDTLRLERLTPETVGVFAEMTFPAYRHMLPLQPTPRHPGQGDRAPVQPLASGAWMADTPAGLVLAEVPYHRREHGELLSVFVDQRFRGQGVGTALVEEMEARMTRGGLEDVTAVYMSGGAGVPAMERIFEKRQWSPPEVRSISVRFTPQEAMETPWFGKVTLRDADFEILPWSAVPQAERDRARRAHETTPWIKKGLEFWNHDHYGFDEVSSLGLRYRGELVGWVINHRLAPKQVRFTCSFMRDDLSRRGRILPLYTESIRRLAEEGCETCTLITPVWYKEMAEFLKRRCAHCVSYFGETRGVEKVLRAATAGTPDVRHP